MGGGSGATRIGGGAWRGSSFTALTLGAGGALSPGAAVLGVTIITGVAVGATVGAAVACGGVIAAVGGGGRRDV